MVEIGLSSDGLRPRCGRIEHIEKNRAAVPWSESFHPGNDELRFAQREAVVVRKLSIAGNCGPRWHVARDDICSNLSSLQPGLFVGLERKRRAALRVAHD